jgi:hypothetical protein
VNLAKGTTSKRKRIPKNAPRALGPTGPVKETADGGGRVSWCGGLGRLGQIPEKIQIRICSLNFIEFGNLARLCETP